MAKTKIEDLKLNDSVWSYRNGEISLKRVTSLSNKMIIFSNETYGYKRSPGDETSWTFSYDNYGENQIFLNRSDAYLKRRDYLIELQKQMKQNLFNLIDKIDDVGLKILQNENEITKSLLDAKN